MNLLHHKERVDRFVTMLERIAHERSELELVKAVSDNFSQAEKAELIVALAWQGGFFDGPEGAPDFLEAELASTAKERNQLKERLFEVEKHARGLERDLERVEKEQGKLKAELNTQRDQANNLLDKARAERDQARHMVATYRVLLHMLIERGCEGMAGKEATT